MIKKLLNSNWLYNKTKRKHCTLVKKYHNNAIIWQISNLDKLITKIDKNLEELLAIILDMQKIYIEYLDQVNKVDK